MRIVFNTEQFDAPDQIIQCRRLADVRSCFLQMENALKKGYYLAGFLSYEAGYAFERLFYNSKTYAFPLIYFGAFAKPASPRLSLPPPALLFAAKPALTKQKYFSALSQIKNHLTAGDTYQVNYTFKLKFRFDGQPYALYHRLKQMQPTPYSAFIETKAFSILSFSPELFFRKIGKRIEVKPMKGTIGLGKGKAARLRNGPKNRAENLMIVDLLRNDLGRIARTGTVRTEKLFAVEKHPTLYQMTSAISAEVSEDIPVYDVFRNLFPSGSVTGAPKIRTMQIIQELEKEERNIYCGAIGYITPQKDMIFNVAIRTLLLCQNRGEMGLGSGITFDSDPSEELEECLLKSNFLDLSPR